MKPTKKASLFVARCQLTAMAQGGWHAVLLRDPCVYCSAPADTIEHILPRNFGGTSSWKNKAPACRRCNSDRGHEPLIAWLLRSRFRPRPLSRRELRKSRLQSRVSLQTHLREEARALNGWLQ